MCRSSHVAAWLRGHNHEVFSVYEEARGADDNDILQRAAQEEWILLTTDKDFGEKIYREHRSHSGVILLRLVNQRSVNKIEVLNQLLENYSTKLSHRFVVVTENRVRFAEK